MLEVKGHIEKMEMRDQDITALYVRLDNSRAEGESLLLRVSRSEARTYQPGDAVILQLRPADNQRAEQ